MILPNHILLPEVEKLLGEGIKVTMRVKGDSMLPFIRGERDSVELQKPRMLRKKSIALARLSDGTYVIHRIIELSGDEVVLMGDGNLLKTEHCRQADIVGEVTQILRNGTFVKCSCWVERVKASVWMMFLPMRRYLLAIYRRLN